MKCAGLSGFKCTASTDVVIPGAKIHFQGLQTEIIKDDEGVLLDVVDDLEQRPIDLCNSNETKEPDSLECHHISMNTFYHLLRHTHFPSHLRTSDASLIPFADANASRSARVMSSNLPFTDI